MLKIMCWKCFGTWIALAVVDGLTIGRGYGETQMGAVRGIR